MHTPGPNHVGGQARSAAHRRGHTQSASSQLPQERVASHHHRQRHHPTENTNPAGSRNGSKRDRRHPRQETTSDSVKAERDDAVEAAAGNTPALEDDAAVGEVERVPRRGAPRRGLAGGAFPTPLDLEGISSCCNLRDPLGRTALHEAAEQGDAYAAKTLLTAGALVDPRCRRNLTPLMLAARRGHGDVVRLLLRAGAGVSDRRGGEGRSRPERWRSTALHHAASGGHAGVVSTLLDAGFGREQHDEAGLTPAEISARAGHPASPAATRRLLGRPGGSGDGDGDGGGKLLYDYVDMVAEDVAIVRGLVDGGVFLDWRDETGGETALHRAAHFRHARIAEVLLRAGADADVRNVRGGSPLHVAASTGCARIMAALLEAGADREARMDNGRSPLHLAVINNKPDAVTLLLRAGASTEHRDSERGQTPLSEASEYALAPVVRLLLQAGADVESRSTAGLTALHWACRFNSPDSVAVLLAAGADPEAVETEAAAAAAAAGAAGTRSPPSQPPTGALRLKAADVIGFGDPSRGAEDPRRPFMGELRRVAERRLDPAARSRIARLLQDAKKDRAWRRRGWLVVLVKRRDSDDARAPVCGGVPSAAGVAGSDGVAAPPGNGEREVNAPQGPKRPRVGAPRGAPQKPQPVGDGSRGKQGALTVDKPSRSLEGATGDGLVGRVGADVDAGEDGEDRGPESAKPQLEEGDDGGMMPCSNGRDRLVAGTVEALLGLASVEAGVFRNVLSYI